MPTIVDEGPVLVIDKESDSKVETDSLGDEVNIYDIEGKITVMVKTVVKEEEVYTTLNRTYNN